MYIYTYSNSLLYTVRLKTLAQLSPLHLYFSIITNIINLSDLVNTMSTKAMVITADSYFNNPDTKLTSWAVNSGKEVESKIARYICIIFTYIYTYIYIYIYAYIYIDRCAIPIKREMHSHYPFGGRACSLDKNLADEW